jgi:uncharacterized damage-inducible protein DinB
MKRTIGGLAVLALLSLAAPRAVRSDDAMPAGVRGDIIGSMMMAAKEVEELAAAMPEKKYDWRPGKGVRSVGEVYLHICQANYMIPSILGATPPVPKDEIMKMGDMKADKAKIAQMLQDSYAFASKAIGDIQDSDLDTQVEFFGQQMPKRALMMVLASHSHEHLGQSIAYARMNGIVPPWTARQEEAAKKRAAEKKSM